MPNIEIDWEPILLKYMSIKKTILAMSNLSLKNEVLQLLTNHIGLIQQKSLHPSSEQLLLKLLSELNMKIAKLSFNDNNSFESYKKLLHEIIASLEIYKKQFDKNRLPETTLKITSSLNNFTATQINENNPILPESEFSYSEPITFTSLYKFSPSYDYYIESLESFIVMELDRYLLLATPDNLKHFIQLSEHTNLTEFLDNTMKLNPLNFGGAIIIYCLLNQHLLDHPALQPYHALIYHNHLSQDMFQESRKTRLQEFISTYLHKFFPNITFNNNNYILEENLYTYEEIIKNEAENNFLYLNLLQEKFKNSKAPIVEIDSIEDLIKYRTVITSATAWFSLTPYSLQWRQLKQSLNLKDSFLPILQAFLYLIEKRCPFDELPQCLPNHMDIFLEYQVAHPNKLKLIFDKLYEYFPLQELADTPLNNHSLENKK